MQNKILNISRCVPLPIGYKLAICPICGGIHLTGALITDSADEQDPDIICKDCGSIINNVIVWKEGK